MKETKHTFCRICEASCGLVVELENGKVTGIEPNRNHIGTDGFACMKGLQQHRIYDSPDRLRHPLKRVGDRFERISWEQALAEIGSKVRELRQESPQSVGMYVGTAAGFSILHPMFAEGFMQGVDSDNVYSSATQDCANRFAAAQELYGSPFCQPFVDLDHVRCLLILGTNPVVSKWTFLQVAHPVKRLKEVMKRGAKVIVVDPRYNETAKVATEHHFIRPGSDLFFLLSFLHELFAQGGVERERVTHEMTGLDELENLVAKWPADKTAEVTGVSADSLKEMVGDYIAAGASAIVTGTGIGMSGRGTLAHWLAEVINAVSGNLDRQGGMLVGKGIADFVGYAKKNGLSERSKRSRIGNFPELNGGFPGGILADEILQPGKGQVKALFVSGGNPLLTMANSARLRDAFTKLELLVVIDIQLNETASLAHYVLPATSPLERADLPFIFPLLLGLQSKPYIAATRAIVKPDGEQRDEATIYTDLATASGVGLFGSKVLQQAMRLMQWGYGMLGSGKGLLPVEFILDLILRQTGNGRFKAMCEKPDGVPLPAAAPGSYLGSRVLHDDGKVHLAPELLMVEATRLESLWQQERAAIAKGEMRLITKRYHHTHNSWTKNIPELISGEAGRTNYLYVHPEDAVRLGLGENSAADIRTKTATIRLPVKYLDDLMPGTVAVPHGWGHQGARGMAVASALAGANVNLLAADGMANIEPVSGMVHLTAIPVEITPAAGPVDPKSWSGIGAAASA